jgi:hypothetical protein
MGAVSSVKIHCTFCGTRFSPPIEIVSKDRLDAFVTWGGIVECVKCHRFVTVCDCTLTYIEDGMEESRDPLASPRPILSSG